MKTYASITLDESEIASINVLYDWKRKNLKESRDFAVAKPEVDFYVDLLDNFTVPSLSIGPNDLDKDTFIEILSVANRYILLETAKGKITTEYHIWTLKDKFESISNPIEMAQAEKEIAQEVDA